MDIEKLKRHKAPVTDQIPAELIKTVGRTIRCEIHKLIIHKKKLKRGRIRSLYLFIRRDIKQIVELQRNISFVIYIHYFIQHPLVKVMQK